MIFYKIFNWFSKRRWLLGLMVALGFCIAGYRAFQIPIEEDITRFIPVSSEVKEWNEILSAVKTKDKMVLLLSSLNGDSFPDELMGAGDRIVSKLSSIFSPQVIQKISCKVGDDVGMRLYETVYDHLPIFLEEKDFEEIELRSQSNEVKNAMVSGYRTLLTPAGLAIRRFFQRDPLSYMPLVLDKLLSFQKFSNFDLDAGYMLTRDHRHLLIVVNMAVEPSDYRPNKAFLNYLDSLKSDELMRNRIIVDYYGAAAVATANADQIKQDTVWTSSIAVLLILIVLVLYFRRLSVAVQILLPVAAGALFSICILSFFHGAISILALGAGSILLGIAINYPIHLFSHHQHVASEQSTLMELGIPMVTGCITTVVAFFGLQLTQSAALRDFGLFAGFSLLGAMLFTLIIMPHFLPKKSTSIVQKSANGGSRLLAFISSLRPERHAALVVAVLLITLGLIPSAMHTGFDGDMMKLNFEGKYLHSVQEKLELLNGNMSQNVFVVASGNSTELALRANERAKTMIAEREKKSGGVDYLNPGILLVSDSLQEVRLARWNQFMESNRSRILKDMEHFGDSLTFKSGAFLSFSHLLSKQFNRLRTDTVAIFHQITQAFFLKADGKTQIVSTLKCTPFQKERYFKAGRMGSDVLIFTKASFTNLFVSIMEKDFMGVLVFTGLLVFIFMLIAQGRIELAVINFLPMLVSWIWILGVMGIIGLQFNIVSMIISTFIFGLGDDYSIFIMDGLGAEYKSGRDRLKSYKSSILISAITITIGFGVLVFAQHPALRSIGMVTVLGMIAVLFVSFVVQPFLYDIFILKRARKKLPPFTFRGLVITGMGFILFLMGSIFLHLVILLLYLILPFGGGKRKIIFHYFLQWVSRFIMYFFINVKKEIQIADKDCFLRPGIFISNHQSMIDLAYILMLHPRLLMVTNDRVWNSFFFGSLVRRAGFFSSSLGFEELKASVGVAIEQGYSVVIFPEGTRTTTGKIGRFHQGAFLLARELAVPLYPILIHGASKCLPKGDFYFQSSRLTLKIFSDVRSGGVDSQMPVREEAKRICGFMRQEYAKIAEKSEDGKYYRSQVIQNFMYKGPVLEWYCRIKTKLEGNYQTYLDLIPLQAEVLDLGCGYGFLPYFLGLHSEARKIVGIDFDNQKIEIASHCYSRTNNITFLHGDIQEIPIGEQDAIILGDVLHYLTYDAQEILVRKCIAALRKDGILIIRDGDNRIKGGHRWTRWSEKWSFGMGFNRSADGKIYFFDFNKLEEMVRELGGTSISCIRESSVTSNALVIIRKDGTRF